MQLTINQVRRLERYALREKPGYDPFPIDDDANAVMQSTMNSKWGNLLAAIGPAASLALFRYKYIIKSGRPAGFVTATLQTIAGKTIIWGDGADAALAFSQCITGGASAGDRITLSWEQSNGVRRIVTGLIVNGLAAGGGDTGLELTTCINPELVLTGDFSADSNWTKGAGWSIAGGVAVAAGELNTALSSTAAITVVAGQRYTLSFDLTRSAGTLTASFDGVTVTSGALTGSYTESFYPADSSGVLAFTGTGFTGTLDNVSLKETTPVADDSVEVELEATYVP